MGAAEAALLHSPVFTPDPFIPCVFRFRTADELVKTAKKNQTILTKRITTSELPKILLGKPHQAIAQKKDAPSPNNEIEMLINSGNLSSAFSRCLEIFELDPMNDSIAILIGTIYLIEKQEQFAKEWFEIAIKINPDNQEALLYLKSLEQL